jgi:hypothetical protein
MEQPYPIVAGLLAALTLLLGLAVLLLCIYRRHLRGIRRSKPGMDLLALSTLGRKRMMAFPAPVRWIAVHSSDVVRLSEWLGPAAVLGIPWSEALARSRERRLFVSPPVDGWMLIIGASVPDPAQNIDSVYILLRRLSAAFGEVHYYGADRVLGFHSWAKVDRDVVVRGYAWAGETLWNEGRTSVEERELGLRCLAYGEEGDAVRFPEMPPEFQNVDRVVLLARRWSIDPIAASEILLHQDGVQSGDNGGPAN